jgi:hypothetical protein
VYITTPSLNFTLSATTLIKNTASASGATATTAEGGGLYIAVAGQFLTTTNVSFVQNRVVLNGSLASSVAAQGGGMVVFSTTPIVEGCTFIGNEARAWPALATSTVTARGGACYVSGGSIGGYFNGSVFRNNSVLHFGPGGTPSNAYGGALCLTGTGLTHRVSSSSLHFNRVASSVRYNGGAIFLVVGTLRVSGVTSTTLESRQPVEAAASHLSEHRCRVRKTCFRSLPENLSPCGAFQIVSTTVSAWQGVAPGGYNDVQTAAGTTLVQPSRAPTTSPSRVSETCHMSSVHMSAWLQVLN